MKIHRRNSITAVSVLTLVVVSLSGCAKSGPPSPADPDRGRAALQSALQAWQEGKKHEELQDRQPPLFVNDTDWVAGGRLIRFQLADGHEYHGAQLRCAATLTLLNKEGKQFEKQVTYLIDTHPALVIVRGDM